MTATNTVKDTVEKIAASANNMVDSAEQSTKSTLTKVDLEARELVNEGLPLVELAAQRARLYADKGMVMAKHASDAVKEKAGEYADTASGKIKENPLKSVAIAAAVGAAVAAATTYAIGRNKSGK